MLAPITLSSVLIAQTLRYLGVVDPATNLILVILPVLSTTLFCFYFLWRVILYPNVFSPLRAVPGPKSHWFYGNFPEIIKEPPAEPHLRWMTSFPGTPFIRYHGLFKSERLMVVSPKAHQYIMTNCYAYPKPEDVGFALKTVLGADGILFAEGDIHRRQRKQMNPSFSYANLKAMVPIFWSKSQELVAAWQESTRVGSSGGKAEVEVLNGLSAATLDIIGSAGFGTEFGAVKAMAGGEPSALAAAYSDMFDLSRASRVLGIITFFLPWVRRIPLKRHRELDHDLAVVNEVAEGLIRDKVARLERGEDIGSDIFALLLKDNATKEAAAEAEKTGGETPMSHKEIADQSLTLLAAGHETTSSGTTWAMHALSTHRDVQLKLRAELQEHLADCGPDTPPTFEKIDSLKYLGNVVKEVLRLFPPVPVTRRTALADGHIEGVFVPKGTNMFVVPGAINRNPHLWGPTAGAFDPDRWDDLPETYSHYGNETFLHGSRGCIGQRFAIMEMKCLLAAIYTSFDVAPKPDHVVEPKSTITCRPKGGLPVILTNLV